MYALAIFAGMAALVLVHLLRAPARGLRGGLVMGALAFGLTTLAVNVLARGLDVRRVGEFDAFAADARTRLSASERPGVLFVGASFTRNAIDPSQLEAALGERGLEVTVATLAMQGASYQERQQQLAQALKHLPRPPAVVWIEVAEGFDRNPAYVFEVGKFSDRAIQQFDAVATGWTMMGLAGGACEGLKACVMNAALLPAHAALNWLNVGLLASGRPAADVVPTPAFDAVTVPRDTVPSQDAILRGLTTDLPAPAASGPQWALSHRAHQRARLAEAGVRTVGYYFPPVVDPAARAYVAGLCAGELSSHPCVPPTDPAMLAALVGPLWLDGEHLLAPAAAAYTGWLADQIAPTLSEALSAALAPQVLIAEAPQP
jgi:hypothetical protein